MSANPSNTNNITNPTPFIPALDDQNISAFEPKDLECDFFSIYHFIMLDNRKLSQDEIIELTDHLDECLACHLTNQQVKAVLDYRSRPTRTELITYLKCLMDQVTGLDHESHLNFHKKHRHKLKKRLAKAEKRIVALEQALAQITDNTSPALPQGGKTYYANQ